jgi:hypothetical protein
VICTGGQLSQHRDYGEITGGQNALSPGIVSWQTFLIDFITLHMLILHGAAQTEPFNRNQKAARRVVAAASQLALRV